jgi:hypothetical protein
VTQTRKFAVSAKLPVAALLAAAAVAVLLIGPESSMARGTSTCPTFRVLGNDRIGPAVLPKGTYSMKVFGSISCSNASSQFTRFLEDYDGKLPHNWAVVPRGRGMAVFTHNGKRRIAVARQGKGGGNPGGGRHHSPQLGTRCPGTFQVLHNDSIGPLKFPKGSYLTYITPGSEVSCAKASKLFAKFLGRPDGSLPDRWRIKGQTAVFYRSDSPKQQRFRVDPGT